jgi:putative membrane protein
MPHGAEAWSMLGALLVTGAIYARGWRILARRAPLRFGEGRLAAILTFADRVIYPAYATIPGAGAISALDDQSMAGVIMWVPGSVVFLFAAVWLVLESMNERGGAQVAPLPSPWA